MFGSLLEETEYQAFQKGVPYLNRTPGELEKWQGHKLRLGALQQLILDAQNILIKNI